MFGLVNRRYFRIINIISSVVLQMANYLPTYEQRAHVDCENNNYNS